MPILEKLKASMHVGSLDMKEKIKIELGFTEKSFIIIFVEPLSEMNLKEIKNIFFPFLSSDYRKINMNYIYIKSIYLDICNLLKFTIYNPLSMSIFPLIINHFVFKKKNIFTKTIPSFNYLNSMVVEIKRRQDIQTKNNINNFINIIHLFYDFRSIERKYNNIINEIFLKAFNFGMIYFNKSMKDFNLSQEKINLIPKDTQRKINKSINDITTELTEPVNNLSDAGDSSDPGDNPINGSLIPVKDVNSELDYDSLNVRDLFQNYPAFEKYPLEIKKLSSYFTEATIILIYKLFNVNSDDLNDKYNEINKTEKGLIINRNNLTNNINNYYFQNEDTQQNYLEDGNIKNEYEEKIAKWFEYCKQFHSFIPNNSRENIIFNTSQMIQRNFFELLFKTYFSDIITIETEKNKTLSSDEFHLVLRTLRRLKKILFSEKNKNLYSNYEFLNEGRSTMDINNLDY